MNLTGVVYNFTLKKYQSFKEYLKWKEKQNGTTVPGSLWSSMGTFSAD